jgi:ubiquinone/menaquinone biosynthesis C-methylase UbiE
MRIQDTVFELVRGTVPAGESILDVGCGSGKLATRLHEAGYHVHCLDRRITCQRLPGIQYIEADLAVPLPYSPASVDNITCTQVLEHLKAPYLALHEFGRILKHGGYLFLSVPNYWSVKYRLKYFFSATMPRPARISPETIAKYHQNLCPHINTITWPTLKFALQVEGFEIVMLRVGNTYSWVRGLGYIPWAVPIKLYYLLRSREKATELGLDETSSGKILYGGSRIAIVARRTSRGPSQNARSSAGDVP